MALKKDNKEKQEIIAEKEREAAAVKDEIDRLRHRMGDLNNK